MKKAQEVYMQTTPHTQGVCTGDRVIMNSRYDVPDEYKGVIWTVLGVPRLKGGRRQARLDGYGWYPVDGLQVVG